MKRCIAGLAFALTLIRMLTAAAYAQEYQTVSQLRESVPARWTTTIETKWRDVAIDAEIVTPDVEAIPVVKVGYDLHPSPLTPEESGWVEVNDSYETGSLILYMTDDTGKPPRKINGRKVNRDPVSKENWYGGFDPNQTYIPLSLSLIHISFTVKVDKKAEIRAGSVTTDAYSAQATLFVSDVDVSGYVYIDCPAWVEDTKNWDSAELEAQEDKIHEYVLIADGEEVQPSDRGYGADQKTGKFFVEVRYDLPESTETLSLRPVYESGNMGGENEEIYLD